MHPLYLILAILILAITSSSCRRNMTTEALTQASELIESHPDSAYAILHGIDLNSIRESDIPLYALLEAQSCHKQDLPLPSDSLLTIGIAHYSAAGPDSLLMKSLYYRAVIRNTPFTWKEAMQDATASWEIASKYNNVLWQAKSAEIIADMYSSSYNAKEAILWRQKTSEYYRRAQRFDNQIYSLCDMIVDFSNNGKYSEALQMIDSLYPIIHENSNYPSLNTYYYGYAIPLLTYHGNPGKAQGMLDSLKKHYNHKLTAEFNCYHAHILMSQHNFKEAEKHLEYARNQIQFLTDSALFYNELALYHKLSGNLSQAYNYKDSVIDTQQKLFHWTTSHELTSVQRDYYRKSLSETSRISTKQKNWISILIGITVFIILATAGIVYLIKRHSTKKVRAELDEILQLRNSMKQQEIFRQELEETILKKELEDNERSESLISAYKKINENNNEISALNFEIEKHKNSLLSVHQELDATSNELKQLHQKLSLQIKSEQILFSEKWATLNIICNEIVNIDEDNVNSKHYINKIRRYLTSLRNPDYISKIEEEVNRYNNNIITRLRDQCAWLKETDICFITLLYAGLNSKSVAFFTEIKVKYFYTKRERLIHRISACDAVDKEEFIDLIKTSKSL